MEKASEIYRRMEEESPYDYNPLLSMARIAAEHLEQTVEGVNNLLEERRRVIEKNEGLVKLTLEGLTPEPLNVAIVAQEIEPGTQSLVSAYDKLARLASSGDHDIVVAPEYFVSDTIPLNEVRLREFLEGLVSVNSDVLIIPGTVLHRSGTAMKNTAFAIADGEVKSYTKHKDGGDFQIAQNYGLGWTGGTDFLELDWRDLKVGVEVCADSGLLKNRDKKDLMFLLSHGMFSPKFSYESLRPGAHVIFAEGKYLEFGSYQHNGPYVLTKEQRLIEEANKLKPM